MRSIIKEVLSYQLKGHHRGLHLDEATFVNIFLSMEEVKTFPDKFYLN